ncbi:MAG: transporter substrate-binding domain-containing protein [Lachnospiraceae bacterium]
MKKMKMMGIASVALVMGLVVAGCGSSTDSSDTAAASTDTAEATTIICALDANVSPYTYYDENGEITGYDYETLKMIDDMLDDYTFEYEMVDYDVAAIGLESGQYDLEAGSKYKTSARAEKFLITDSNYYAAVTLAVRKDSGITSIEDMAGKTLVPVPEADGLRQVYLDYMEANPDADITQDTGSSLISIADGLAYVAAGQYDGMIDPPDMFYDVLDEDENLASQITVIEDPFTVVGGHFLLNNANEDLYTQINEALAELKSNGKLGALSEEWFGEDLIAKYADIAND